MPKRPRPSKERFYVYLRKEYTVIYSTSGPFKTISNDEGSNRQISGILNRGILTRFGTYEEALEHCKSNWSTIKTAYIPYIYFQDEYRHEESVCIEPENGIDTWENDTFSHEEHNENAFIDYLKTKTFSEDQKSTGFSPAHTAAQHGYINALIYLKGNDFNLNAQDKRGYTPLHYASLKVQKEAILFLLSQKVDCTLKTHNRQDVPMHERNAIASRLLMLQRYQTPIKRKEVEEISLYFPCVTHGGMIINLERDSDNILRIKNFDITNLNNTTPFYTFGDYAENPDYFDENGLKPGLQQRHIKSADSIKESFLKEWIGISIDDIIT
ncbi:MAG: ankyrin repeat domain-containing protein, partial [Proteobacteria bacterium]|nr:ankyrin repeat domain-containing protein [Pseudomonadota bacterium]